MVQFETGINQSELVTKLKRSKTEAREQMLLHPRAHIKTLDVICVLSSVKHFKPHGHAEFPETRKMLEPDFDSHIRIKVMAL